MSRRAKSKTQKVKNKIKNINKFIKIMLDKVLNILYYITINKSKAQEVQKVRKIMTITYELDLERFEAWSGAKDTLDRVREEGKCSELENILEDLYPDGMTETDLNDLLCFDSESVYEWLGIDNDEED